MEYLGGGELYDRLMSQPGSRFEEAEAASIMRQLVSAVYYLHHAGIVHRDLKLENFLFDKPRGSIVKLIDFGLSHRYSEAAGGGGGIQRMHSVVGTPY